MAVRRGRIGTSIDVNRLAAGIARPGIDPRTWVSLALASGDSVMDPKHGVFIDVELLPTGESVTCYVPQEYAGSGFGENQQKIHKDDLLVVALPNGDPNSGGVVLKRMHSEADKPPELATQNPADYVRVQETDTSWRLKLTGAGKWLFDGASEVYFKSAGKATHEASTFTAKTNNVRLGDESADQQVIRGTVYRTNESTKNTTDQAAFGVINGGLVTQTAASAQLAAAGALMIIPIVGAMLAAPFVTAASAQMAAAAATMTGGFTTLTTSSSTFEASAITYLSTVSKTV